MLGVSYPPFLLTSAMRAPPHIHTLPLPPPPTSLGLRFPPTHTPRRTWDDVYITVLKAAGFISLPPHAVPGMMCTLQC